jgi:hypothetical protein
LLPIAALFLSDLVIGLHSLAGVVYLSMIPMVAAGVWIEDRVKDKSLWKSGSAWGAGGLAASIFFFAVTNFAVWLTSGMYAMNIQGLETCFVMAIPFFNNQLLSTLLFTGVLFGVWDLSHRSLALDYKKVRRTFL